MEQYNIQQEDTANQNINSNNKEGVALDTFTECIMALAKNIDAKSPACEELQELFFKLASTNTTLPETATYDVIDSFIKIITVFLSSERSYDITLQTFNVFLSYLKNDSRVLRRLYPSKQFFDKINIDKHLHSPIEDTRKLAIEIVSFLLRHCEDLDYSNITSDTTVWKKLRKFEYEYIQADIERLEGNQENMMNVAKKNQEMTSKAFTELFVYIEEMKQDQDQSIKELKMEISRKGTLKNSEGKYLQQDDKVTEVALTRRLENELKDKLQKQQQQIDYLISEIDEIKRKYEVSNRRLELTSVVADDTAKKTVEMLDMIKIENKLIEDTNEIILTRLSRAENDILSLINKYVEDGLIKGTHTMEDNTEGIQYLRLDSLRSQIELDIFPKVNQIHMRIKALNIKLNTIETTSKHPTTQLYTKLNDKGINAISALIKAGVDTMSSEVRGCKKLIETLKEQTVKMKETQDWLLKEFKKEMEIQMGKNSLIESELQKEAMSKYRQLDELISTHFKNNNKNFGSVNEKVKKLVAEFEKFEKEIKEALNDQLVNATSNSKVTDEKFKVLSNDIAAFNLKVAQLENENMKFARYDEENMKFARLEERLMKVTHLEETLAAMPALQDKIINLETLEERMFKIELLEERIKKIEGIKDKLIPIQSELNQVNVAMVAIRDGELEIQRKLRQLEDRPASNTLKEDLNLLRMECERRINQIKIQMKEYFDYSWSYIHRYTKQHIVDKIKKIKSPASNYTQKLNCLDWFARYNEYIDGDSASSLIQAFKETINQSKVYERTTYISAKHNSDVMSELVKRLRNLKKGTTTEELARSLREAGTYLSIIEVAIINEQNAEQGLNLGLLGDLLNYITFFKNSYDIEKLISEFKLLIRCLTYCFRTARAIDLLLELPNGIPTILSLIEEVKEEDMRANVIQILKVCLRSDKQYDQLISKHANIFDVLVKFISVKGCNVVVLEESTAALMSYTRKPYSLDVIKDTAILGEIFKLATEKTSSKYKEYSIAILKNCCKKESLLEYMKEIGALELISR